MKRTDWRLSNYYRLLPASSQAGLDWMRQLTAEGKDGSAEIRKQLAKHGVVLP